MQTLLQQSRAAALVFRLPLRDAVWRGLHGQFAGQESGNSLDFQDHRPYFPGDDPRHINWQAYARTGSYTMKLYRQETSPRVDLVIDASRSMNVDPAKAERSIALAMFCAESALRLGSSLRIHAATTTGASPVEASLLLSGRWQIPEVPAVSSLSAAGQVSNAPALARVPFRHGALRVLISDLLFPAETDGLRLLATAQARGIVFAPWCESEAHPDWEGNHQFEDVETGGIERRRVTPSLIRRYTDAYVRHFEVWRAAALRHGIRLARIGAGGGDLVKVMRSDALPVGAVEPCM